MANRSETFDIKFKGKDQSVGRTLKGLDKDMSGFSKKASRFSIGVAGAFASAFAVTKVVGFGKALFDLGQDASVWGIKVDTVFGNSAGAVNRWADNINESMGLSQERVAGLAANMGDLLVPLGATRQEAAAMSQNLVGLSGSLSAWSGGTYDAAQVSDILAKALLGERESLKSLGISISQAEVNERALTLAKEDGRKEITKLDQARASETLILEKSADAQEAWNNGSLDHIKNVNKLKASWEDLKITLAEWVTPKVTSGIDALLGLFDMGGEPIFTPNGEPGFGDLSFSEPGAGYAAGQAILDWWEDNSPTIIGFLDGIADAGIETFTLIGEALGAAAESENWDELETSTNDLTTSFARLREQLGPLGGAGGDFSLMDFSMQGVVETITGGLIAAIDVLNGIVSALSWSIDTATSAWDDLLSALGRAIPRPSFRGVTGGIGGIIEGALNPFTGRGRAAGGYITRPELSWIGEGSQNEFVFNASQMRGLAQEGIELSGRGSSSMAAGPSVNVNVEGSILSESALAELINRLIRDQRVGGGNPVMGVI